MDWDAVANFLNKWAVPDWLSSIGTVVAIVALVVELHKARSEREHFAAQLQEQEHEAERQAREEQVRRVTGWAEVSGDGRRRSIRPFVENASDMAIFGVSLFLVGSPITVAPKTLPVVAPRTRSHAVDWLLVPVGDEHPVLEIQFTDANGTSWSRRGADFRIIRTDPARPSLPSAGDPVSGALPGQLPPKR